MNDTNKHSDMTTHAGWGEGDPRLLVSSEEERFVFHLTDDETSIGSSPQCSLTLAGIDPVHAVIHHNEDDEFSLELHGKGETNVNLATAEAEERRSEEVLRTGAHFTAGPWRFVYTRDEYADHGRPFGGREGGELSDQPPQPARPDYSSPED